MRLQPLHQVDKEKWVQEKGPGDGVFYFRNKISGKVLTLKGSDLAPGNVIIEAPKSNDPSQQWRLKEE